jgi:cytochrome P450
MYDPGPHDLTLDEAGRMLIHPDIYQDESVLRRVCTRLREEDPIHFVEPSHYPPVWVLTRYRDIREVEHHHREFIQGQPPFLDSLAKMRQEAQLEFQPRTIIHMDGEEHKIFRALTSSWFTPKNLARLTDRLAELARRAANKMQEAKGSCDFANDIAVPYPLEVIMSILGIPDEDYGYILKLSNGLVGAPGEADTTHADGLSFDDVFGGFFEYFTRLTQDRRAWPTDDLASVIANARLPNDKSLELGDAIWYYIFFAVAGHDTTSSAIAGGMLALLEHPEQLQRLKADGTLIQSATEEVIRWVTPVKHVARLVQSPYLLGDHEFEVGNRLFLSYPAANFDPAIYEEPDKFDVGRVPNDHLAFGFGPHFCLGAQLARMEIRAMLRELVPRLDTVALCGQPERVRQNQIPGLKHLPITYQLADSVG